MRHRTLPWRARAYVAGVPHSGRIRAFSTERRAMAWASARRAVGFATEVWMQAPLPLPKDGPR